MLGDGLLRISLMVLKEYEALEGECISTQERMSPVSLCVVLT
jgi:hypothetical protein